MGESWRTEIIPTAATTITHEQFEVSGAFQAEASLLRYIDFNISFRDIEMWTDFVRCAALHGTSSCEIKGFV